MRKLLIIEDDEGLAWAVQKKFESVGYQVELAHTGREGVQKVEETHPDLVILDLNLPDVDGLDVCRYLRRRSRLPVIMLTARAEDNDTIVGLEIGADDYVTKPFNLNELAARVRAVLRRVRPELTEFVAGGSEAAPPGVAPEVTTLLGADMEMDLQAKRVWVEGEEVFLTPTEFRLLQTLLENQGKVVSHQQLMQAGWGYENDDTHLLEVHIANLRGKVESTPKPRRIRTVRGFGYRIDEESLPPKPPTDAAAPQSG